MLALRRFAVPLMPLVLILFWSTPAMSSTTGKIAGIVTDGERGTPLEGVTVKVEGTRIVTETDMDGEFYIINLPVGIHTLTVTMLGYEKFIMRDVRVLMDLTTPLEFEMQSSPVELDKATTVVAQRPLIQRDKTSSGAIVTRDEIAYLANAQSIGNIISNMNGTVVDGDGNIHVRGGRQGSITYFFDGFSIQNPFTNAVGMRIVPDALEELSLTMGGVAPEYGEALSGIVHGITREGGESFRGRVKVYDGATHEYDVTTGKYGGLTRTDDQSVALDISGPITNIGGRMATFFAAGEFVRNDGYLPHNEQELFSGAGKLVMFPASNVKMTFNGSYFTRDQQFYDHRDVNGMSYDFNLDGLGKIKDEAYLVGLKTNYNKSANTVISFGVNRFETDTRVAPEHLFDLYWNEWPGYSEDINGVYNGTIDDSNYNYSEDYAYYGFTDGNDFVPYFLDRNAAYTGGSFSFMSQLDKYNQIKLGGDVRHYDLHWDNRQFYNVKPYGETYDASPWFGAAYLQDKVELNDMVINAGLRFDYLYTDIEYWNNPIEKDYRKDSKPKVQWSPRLGISHPVSANSVLHFNYGYLFQVPQMRLMYTNLQGNLESGYPLIGNPDLDAEKTIYYELGLTHLIGDNLRLNLTTYYRDIKNMVGAREVVDDNGNIFTVFTNSDYGSSKGFDVSLESVRNRLLNWSLNYSYMIARGNASDPFEWYYDYYTVEGDSRPPIPTREYPLAYDQRHNLTAVFDFRVPRGEYLELLGWKTPGAWGVNVLGKYGSGLAYTRTDKNGAPSGALNDERMPYTMRVDLRFNKDFYFAAANRTFLSFFIEVENLFDRRNVVNVYTSTGEPDDDGREVINVNSATYDQELVWNELMARDPQNYSHPRQVRVGFEFNF